MKSTKRKKTTTPTTNRKKHRSKKPVKTVRAVGRVRVTAAPPKEKRWIVRAPITVVVCAEVAAKNEAQAIEKAGEQWNSLSQLCHGCDFDYERPTLIGTTYKPNCWFDPDYADIQDFFYTKAAFVSPKK